MTAETIEGEVIETALVVQEPMRLSALAPEDTIGLASRMATALKDIVEKQRLYAVIQGKKYPQVEAWMTIARMDNVVAREHGSPVRHDDGSYEATVRLIRLSDGMEVGEGSALCGTPDDKPWNSRSEPARRSMAVTRATSRAFRQQYSWIMALAGYEPTPAEEMPRDDAPSPSGMPQEPRNVTPARNGSLVGTAEVGKAPSDFELRESPDGHNLSFRLKDGGKSIKVVCADPIASALWLIRDDVIGQRVTCWGRVSVEGFAKDGKRIEYEQLWLERIQTPDVILPAPTYPDAAAGPDMAAAANPLPPLDPEIEALDF